MTNTHFLSLRSDVLNHNLIPIPVKVTDTKVSSDFLYQRYGVSSVDGLHINTDYREALLCRAKLIDDEVDHLMKLKATLIRASEQSTEQKSRSLIYEAFGSLKAVK